MAFMLAASLLTSTTGVWGDKIALVNLDGTMVLVMGNSVNEPCPLFSILQGDPAATT
jgi:hypothetical protein